MKRFAWIFALVLAPVVALGQNQPVPNLPISTSATITTSGGAATLYSMLGQNQCTIDVVGTFSGTLAVQASTGWSNVQVTPYTTSVLQTGITAAGLYYANVSGVSQLRVIGPTNSGSAAVYVNCVYLPGGIAARDVVAPLGIVGRHLTIPTPFPLAGNCIGVAGYTVSYTCSTPGPVPIVTASPPISATTVGFTTTITCGPCVTGLTAGSNIVVGTGPTPSVAMTAAPVFTGPIGCNGAAASPSPLPSGTNGTTLCVQATAQPTMQPGNTGITGAYFGSQNVPASGSITANQITSGSLLCNSVAFLVSACDAGPPIPSSAHIVFAGDSITFGLGINNQTTFGCSHYTWPSPCFADQVTSFYGIAQGNEANVGVPSTCLEATTTTGSLCNPSVATPFINSYTSLLSPYVGNSNTWFVLAFGTNDVTCGYVSCNGEAALDTQVSAATFKADYATIVAYLLANGVPASHIIIDEVGYLQFGASNSLQSNLTIMTAATFSFNAAISQVARANPGVRVALGYAANSGIDCPPNGSLVNTCLFDGTHPNNTGHANLAAAIERSSVTNAMTAQAESAVGGITSGLSWYLVTNPYYKQFNVSTINLTGGASNFGTIGAYHLNTQGTAFSGQTFVSFGTGTDVVGGVSGNCWEVKTGTSVVLYTLDCSGNASYASSVTAPLSASASTCTGGYRFGSTGPEIFSFAGAPTCSAPNASLYLRTDGTTGSRMYVSAGAGTWNAVAGV